MVKKLRDFVEENRQVTKYVLVHETFSSASIMIMNKSHRQSKTSMLCMNVEISVKDKIPRVSKLPVRD